MNCTEIQWQLMDYASHRLSAAEAGAVDAHLAVCAECRAVLEEERALGTALSAVPQAKPRTDLWDAARMRRAALESARPTLSTSAFHQTRRPIWRVSALAFSAGVAALALMLSPSQPTRESEPPDLVQTMNLVRQAAHSSDNPLDEVTTETWAVLVQDGKDISS